MAMAPRCTAVVIDSSTGPRSRSTSAVRCGSSIARASWCATASTCRGQGPSSRAACARAAGRRAQGTRRRCGGCHRRVAWARRKFGLGIAAASLACGRREEVEVTTPSSAPPSERTVLRELLAENRTRDPEYGGGLSNHLSMALVALAQLGADDARLAAFARRYERRLDPMRALAEPIAWAKWRDGLGREEALTSVLAAFDLRLRERGRDEVLAEVVPALVPALGAQLFHGLIRTAYALRIADDEELAHGLAYWASAATPLRALPAATAASDSPAALMAAARSDRELAQPIRGGP